MNGVFRTSVKAEEKRDREKEPGSVLVWRHNDRGPKV